MHVLYLSNVANKTYTIMTYMLWMFIFKQFKEWRFLLSGVGLLPQPLEIERTTTYVHLQAFIVIAFKNPTKEDVLLNIILTSKLFFLHFTCYFVIINQTYFIIKSMCFRDSGHFRTPLTQQHHFIKDEIPWLKS